MVATILSGNSRASRAAGDGPFFVGGGLVMNGSLVTGPNNNAGALASMILDADGLTQDDILVYREPEDDGFFLVVNASNAEHDLGIMAATAALTWSGAMTPRLLFILVIVQSICTPAAFLGRW